MNQRKSVSIVIPVFNEAENLSALIKRLNQVTQQLSSYVWSYIFVNDGSSDPSWEVIKAESKETSCIIALDLSRNFGKEIALTAGMHETDSDAVICMDSDLQHPPELIPQLITAWENGAEIVTTCRKSIDQQPWLRRCGASIFYWLMNKISSVKMLSNTTDFRLFDKKVVFVFKRVTEKGRMFRGIIDWMGFRSKVVYFHADARQGGEVGYSYRKLIQLATDALTSFSLFPLRLISYLGSVISFLSGALLFAMLITRFFVNKLIFSSLAFIAVGNTFLIGIVLIGMGLVAIYVGKIHIEVLGRPLFIIRERLENTLDWKHLIQSLDSTKAKTEQSV